MRGSDQRSGALFSYVDLEARVRRDHPLRPIRAIVNAALDRLGPDFAALYSGLGRPSIPPERLLRALLLQAFYGIRSERQIMERLEFDLLFRWFVGLGVDDAVWDQTTFSKNRDRLLAGDVAAGFLAEVLADPKVKRLTSTEHFSVDGTLIEAWASMKSFRRKDGSDEPPAPGRNGERDFHGEKRSNGPRRPAAAQERRPGGQALLHGPCADGEPERPRRRRLPDPDGHAERVAALAMIEPRADRPGRITLGADKGYDAEDFVNELRSMRVVPHVAAKAKGSAVDGRTTRHPGYAASLRVRKRIEEAFGWAKAAAGFSRTRHRGLARVGWQFTLAMAAYNLVRLPKLLALAA